MVGIERSPTAFVSWAHSDDAWQSKILDFVYALRKFGIDADVDLFHAHKSGVDWSTYGPDAIRRSDVTIIAASATYKERWEQRRKTRSGAGAAREANVLKDLFDRDHDSFLRKVTVVLLEGITVDDVPAELASGLPHFEITGLDQNELEDLLRRLTGQPAYVPAPVGRIPILPPALRSAEYTPSIAVTRTPGVEGMQDLSTGLSRVAVEIADTATTTSESQTTKLQGVGAALAAGFQVECETRISEAARVWDWTSVRELAAEYARSLPAATTLGHPVVTRVLDLLRTGRQYEALMEVADAALAVDPGMPGVWRRYAQALVDRGSTTVALRLYRGVFEDLTAPDDERIEARGGIGRCYKQLFLDTTDSDRRADYLQRALDLYLVAYNADTQHFWLGINAAALLTRASREDIAVSAVPDTALTARTIATQVLETVDTQQHDQWAKATACEASVALGLDDEAVQRGAVFAEDRDTDAFAIASLLRQLQEVWNLDTTTPLGNALLPILRGALLKREGGRVLLPTRDVGASRLDRLEGLDLEMVLGIERYQTLAWYRTGLRRCRAVARVETLNEDGLGTGFLVKGAALHGSLPERVLVTNSHVIPEHLDPRNAVVAFHGLDADAAGPNRFRVSKRWWYEPSSGPHLDTTVLELDGYPQQVDPIPLAPELPALTPTSRAYVIGHPRGLQQPQFSLQDNLILDRDDTHLHYRSPTEGGSSGSPVFDGQWQLIGLHHAGGFAVPRLNNKGGTYEANEAITLDAIRNALANRPPAAVD